MGKQVVAVRLTVQQVDKRAVDLFVYRASERSPICKITKEKLRSINRACCDIDQSERSLSPLKAFFTKIKITLLE